MAARPDSAPITVILLDYNGHDVVRRCIQSLVSQRVLPEKVVFVDNGSAEFDEAAIRATFGPRLADRLEVLRLNRNQGYSGGMNRGLERARELARREGGPSWAMALSNDTKLDLELFARLRERLTAVEKLSVGMIAAKIRAMDRPDLLDGTGLAVSLDGMSTARGQRERDAGQFDAVERTLCPSGVAAIYRIEMLEEVGLFDEDFGAYCEDTDLGLRAWLAGWDCDFAPECIVFHARSTTLGEHSLKKLFLVERNHFWVALKNMPWPLLLINPAMTSLRYGYQAYALASRRGQGQGYGVGHSRMALLMTTLKAWLDAGRGAPRAIRKRFASRAARRRSVADQLRLFWGDRLPFADLILK